MLWRFGWVVLLAGCLDDRDVFQALQSGELPPGGRVDLPRPGTESATRVYSALHDIRSTNPELKFRPSSLTLGVADVTLFHRGTDNTIFVSEGLVKRCPTDARLKAVLAAELGQMAAEKAAARGVSPEDELPPIDPPRPNEVAGATSSSDMIEKVELAEYEERVKSRGRAGASAAKLAERYLKNAGVDASELAAAWPLIAEARAESRYSRRLIPSRLPPQ